VINGSGLRDVDFDDLTEHGQREHMCAPPRRDQSWLEFDFGQPQKLSTISSELHDTWHTNQGVRR
jgi:hypothetical protein